MSGLIGGAGANSGVIGATELDYEIGTWTPTVSDGSAYSWNTGSYIKIGRQVTVNFYMHLSSHAGGSSQKLQGLPFNFADTVEDTSLEAFGTGNWNNMTATNWTSVMYAGINDTATAWVQNGEGGSDVQTATGGDFSNTTYLRGTITYITD